MAVIDGKYEVLSQFSLGEGQVLLSATAPDGTALNIVWLELKTPQQEARFERYRQALRALKRAGLGALYDIVARPGATYVAWQVPGARKRVVASEDLETLLAKYGYSAEQADVRSDGGGQRVYGLSFGDEELPAEPPAPVRRVPKRRAGVSLKQVWQRTQGLPSWALPWGMGATLSLLGVLFFYLSFSATLTNDLVHLPDLQGQNVNAAARRLYNEHLAVSLEPAASERTPFEVVGSEPAAGTALRPGQRVRLRYALPPDQVALTQVPDLRGLELADEVQTLLETSKLKLGEVAYIHSPIKSNFIVAQSRPSGTQTEEGSNVDILVSEGLEGDTTFVPDLTGLPFEEAQALGRLAGLRVLKEERSDNRYPSGTVIAQNLPPFTPVDLRGAVLRLSVAGSADTPASRLLPSLIGMERDEALRAAQEAGYTLRFATVEDALESLNLPEGVVNQTPVEGEENVLDILYNVHPTFIPRPQVSAQFLRARSREAPYNFYVEPNIPTVEARVTATTLEGKTFDVLRSSFVKGGDSITGVWETQEPGPITFYLYLGSGTQPYAGATVNP